MGCFFVKTEMQIAIHQSESEAELALRFKHQLACQIQWEEQIELIKES